MTRGTHEKKYLIGEICQLYGISTDALRYYEKKGLIEPKRQENGYRYYSMKDIWRLNLITDLRKLDFTVEQIKLYLENRKVTTTVQLMKEELKVIEKLVAPLMKQHKDLKKRIKDVEQLQKNETIG